VRPRIFEPFFTTKGKNGSGLGLSMCWRIAHQHGGTLEVESRANEGTTFTLTLPAAASDETSVQEAPMDSEQQTQRVLLIDDQPDVRESVSDMLKALGHKVSVAADGRTALQLVQNGTFDVVLTDLRMPGMDGLDLAKRLRTLRPDVPVVLLTGWGTFFENTQPEAIAVVLPKPPTLHSLSEAINRAASDVAA
jgi:CheY-like chemotaxis protein